jgi:hypothetical protein
MTGACYPEPNAFASATGEAHEVIVDPRLRLASWRVFFGSGRAEFVE